MRLGNLWMHEIPSAVQVPIIRTNVIQKVNKSTTTHVDGRMKGVEVNNKYEVYFCLKKSSV